MEITASDVCGAGGLFANSGVSETRDADRNRGRFHRHVKFQSTGGMKARRSNELFLVSGYDEPVIRDPAADHIEATLNVPMPRRSRGQQVGGAVRGCVLVILQTNARRSERTQRKFETFQVADAAKRQLTISFRQRDCHRFKTGRERHRHPLADRKRERVLVQVSTVDMNAIALDVDCNRLRAEAPVAARRTTRVGQGREATRRAIA